MKHFIDIERAKEPIENNDLVKPNTNGFRKGDLIQITTKVDGSNASIQYDVESDSLLAFSRKQELSFNNTLQGFWNFVQTLDKEKYKDTPNLVVFGEWVIKNKILYEPDVMKTWIVYDIYDTDSCKWMKQDFVKEFCKSHDLTYINVLYEGEFISWDHVRGFLGHHWKSLKEEEGIVVKNQTLLNTDEHLPCYLKIVNESFSEVMKEKYVDPALEAEKEKAQSLVESIVTERRVEKMIYSLRDQGLLPISLSPQDMKTVAKFLPKAVYEDCLKEEPEIVRECGEHFGKMCGSTTMKIARNIVCG